MAPPLGRLPARVRGRDALLAELRRPLARRRPDGGVWVLTGMGGIGKSTLALTLADRARARGWRVWWVTATDSASLIGGMLEVLGQLGAPDPLIRLVREGAPTAPGRAWDFIGETGADGRWLLVFDGADNPAVLAAAGHASPADGTGWLRPDSAGVIVVTTRHKDVRAWGHRVLMRELQPLDAMDAGRVLGDLVPGIVDPGGQQSRELGRRLGGLPLALHLAGTYLASPFARWQSFADYLDALDSDGLPGALGELDDTAAQASVTVTRTWELSLDALADEGCPQARPLLFLLSCYAPAAPIPVSLLRPGLLTDVLTSAPPAAADEQGLRRLRDVGLHSLATVGLISTLTDTDGRAVTAHPVVADVNRSRLLTTGRRDLDVIGPAAVVLLHAACEGLDVRRPADWPTWRRLLPHASALLGWLAGQLDAGTLATLVTDSALIAGAAWRSGTYAPAERLARSCVAAAGRLGGVHPASLTARSQLAQVVAERWHDEAEQLFRALLTDQQRVLGDDHPQTMASKRVLARLLGLQGRQREAESAYRRLAGDCHRLLGRDHPESLATRHGLARVVARDGRVEEAERLYRELLADAERVLGDDHPECLTVRHGLAQALDSAGRAREAEQMYRRLLADCRRVLGEDHPETLGVRHGLASARAGLGYRREAWWLYRRLLADCRRVLGDDHPQTVAVRRSLRTR